ncbi:MAG: helix-turn-helix domain-containing protein [Pseudomonadota bacterium]
MTQFKGYGQFCPISRAAEILAERWTFLLVRELICGSVRFNELQRGVPRMSSALLSRRLKELEQHGILERRRAANGKSWEYQATEACEEIFPVLEAMGNWAQRWVRDDLTVDANLDPDLLMWDMRRNVKSGEMAKDGRFVVGFEYAGVPANRRRYWLVFEHGEVDLCHKNPGFEVDLYVSAHIRTIVRIWLGHETLSKALGEERVVLDGSAEHRKGFVSWFALSIFAPAGRQPPASIRAGRLERIGPTDQPLRHASIR